MIGDSDATVYLLGDGLTQHRNAVATIKEVTNLALAQGNIGKPGAGPVPGPRPLQRAGRPHDGHLGAAARRTSWTPCRRSSASTRRARTGWTPSIRSGPCATARPQLFLGDGRQFRPGGLRTPTSPRRQCAGPG